VGLKLRPGGRVWEVNEITGRPDNVVAVYWMGVMALFCTATRFEPVMVKVSGTIARLRSVEAVAGDPLAVT
jgi:hypothetical protein